MVDGEVYERMERPGLNSSEMLLDAYGTLRRYYGSWIREDPAVLTEFWRIGSLMKQVASQAKARSGEIAINRLLVCGSRDSGLPGLELEQHHGDGMDEDVRFDLNSRILVFVTDKESCPAWLKKQKKSRADAVLVLDQPVLGGLYVARLSCLRFDDKGSYQVLAGRGSVTSVSTTGRTRRSSVRMSMEPQRRIRRIRCLRSHPGSRSGSES